MQYDSSSIFRDGMLLTFLGSAWHASGAAVTPLVVSYSGERCFEGPCKRLVT